MDESCRQHLPRRREQRGRPRVAPAGPDSPASPSPSPSLSPSLSPSPSPFPPRRGTHGGGCSGAALSSARRVCPGVGAPSAGLRAPPPCFKASRQAGGASGDHASPAPVPPAPLRLPLPREGPGGRGRAGPGGTEGAGGAEPRASPAPPPPPREPAHGCPRDVLRDRHPPPSVAERPQEPGCLQLWSRRAAPAPRDKGTPGTELGLPCCPAPMARERPQARAL